MVSRHFTPHDVQQAAQLTAIFEAIDDGLVVLDAEGRLVRENAAQQCLEGRGAQSNTGAPDVAHLSLSERMALFAARDKYGRPLGLDEGPLPRALRGEILSGAEAMDIRSRTLDGREVDLSVSAAPLWDRDGHLTGAVGIFRDQTEQKRLEQERLLNPVTKRARGVWSWDCTAVNSSSNCILAAFAYLRVPPPPEVL